MNCMKCGVEIPEDQVFCPECLAVMADHPIAPGTPVQILKRPARTAEKKPKELTPAEQIAGLKKVVRWMLATICVLTAAVLILSMLLFYKPKASESLPVTGRNYTAAPR